MTDQPTEIPVAGNVDQASVLDPSAPEIDEVRSEGGSPKRKEPEPDREDHGSADEVKKPRSDNGDPKPEEAPSIPTGYVKENSRQPEPHQPVTGEAQARREPEPHSDPNSLSDGSDATNKHGTVNLDVGSPDRSTARSWPPNTPVSSTNSDTSPNHEFPSFGSALGSAYVPTPPPPPPPRLVEALYEAKMKAMMNQYEEKLIAQANESNKKLESYREALDRRNKENEVLASQLLVANDTSQPRKQIRTDLLAAELASQDRTLLDLALSMAQMNNNLMRFLADMRKQYSAMPSPASRK